jgi:hypothetical protein
VIYRFDAIFGSLNNSSKNLPKRNILHLVRTGVLAAALVQAISAVKGV